MGGRATGGTRRAAVVGALLALLTLLGCSAMGQQTTPDRESIVATVNGEPLRVGELRLMMSRTRSAVAAYFQEKIAGETDDIFRLDEVGGEQPLEVWKQTALQALVRSKLEQLAGVREGVLEAADYAAFLDQLAAENKRREQAVSRGEVVYGPVTYTEDAYYDYVLTNAQERLKEKLASGVLALSDSELRQYYEERKTELYRQEDQIKIAKLVISYVDTDGRISDERRLQASEQIEEAARRLADGAELTELAEQYSAGPEAAEGVVQRFDSETARIDQRYRPKLWEAVQQMKPGQTSGVLEFNNAYYLLQCLARTDGGTRDYAEVREDVRSRLLAAKFERWLDDEIARAQVQIEPRQWEHIR